ncbi:Lysozyme-like domain superfamily [Sesbania bispinosa]|nr:Lysozyme-like domain superfamily [Sesbania bispinosa]
MKMKMRLRALAIVVAVSFILGSCGGEQCGRQAGGALCPGGLCCSQFGWCGSTIDYCGQGCQSQCSGSSGDLGSIISRDTFNQMLKHRDDGACPAKGFYTYDAFIAAAKAFPNFGTTGRYCHSQKGDCCFLWPNFSRNYREQSPSTYCASSAEFPCAPGKQYYGRGPIQISWNYNYGQCGRAIGVDLLNNPDLVATDPVISFKTAIWFWMTPQSPKPSCHDVITGRWNPSSADRAAGRLPGYGTVTNIINGGLECGRGQDSRVQDRIGFYKRYCDLLGVGYGDNLDCSAQRPFGSSLLLDSI